MKEVVSRDNMRKSDAYTVSTLASGKELMWRAGEGIYKSVAWQGRIGIVCGSGNNAGDGYALALILKENGIESELIITKNKFSEDGEFYFKKCIDVSIKHQFYNSSTIFDYDIIVDCILGTGFFGEVRESEREIIEKINSSGAYVVSADINSGLDSDTGLCDVAVRSDITVSIGTIKAGHILAKAKDYIKKLVNLDIGISLVEKPYYLVEAGDCVHNFAKRDEFSNKGTYGCVALIGGCTEYSGAIKLANLSLSALRSGAGISKLVTARSVAGSVMPYLLESTLCTLDDVDGSIIFNPEQLDSALKGVRAVAIGMGIGQKSDAYEIISHILKNYEIPVIIDADGLNALSKGDMSILSRTKCKVVLTPHPKELERLSGIATAEILSSGVGHAVSFARKYGVIVLLKGTATVVTDGEDVYLVNRGCAGMASAGSGDVLSGILLALCAQSHASENMISAVYSGAYLNGMAGELAQAQIGDISMIASDTVSKIPEAIRKIRENASF